MASHSFILYTLFAVCFLINIVKSQTDDPTLDPTLEPTLNPTTNPTNATANPTSDQECRETIECSGRGQCIEDSSSTSNDICLCDDGYTTYDAEEDKYCNYPQKEQLTAFLLSFFLGGAGAGRFYLENWLLAGLKLGFCVGFPCIICCIMCCFGIGAGIKDDMGSEGLMAATGCVGCCLICIYTLGWLAWWLIDVILIGIGDVTDGNGANIYQNM